MGGERMAAAELRRGGPPGRRGLRELARRWALAYAGVWTATLLPAGAIALAGHGATGAVRGALGLALRPDAAPTVAAAAGVWLHNLPICAWPLLLTPIGAHRRRMGRLTGDLLVGGCVAVNALPVGAALGAYGRALLPYVPQLPVEWAGLAAGAGWWLCARRRAPGRRDALAWAGAVAAVLLVAALIETWGVPCR